jgi:hypothetical protein
MQRNYCRYALKVALAGVAFLFLQAFSCNWQNYPHLWPNPTYKSWLVLKCEFPDAMGVPSGLDLSIDRFLTIAGITSGNILDYYSDVSYGAVSLAGNRVIGWFPSGYKTTQLSGPGNRYLRVQACADQIPASQAADIDFDSYWGIVIVTNKDNDGGACYTGQSSLTIQGKTYNLGCIVFDPDSLYITFAAHEFGHGLGMPHSWDDLQNRSCGSKTPGEYCDPWDIMGNPYGFATFTEFNYVTPGGNNQAGPGVNVPNLLHQGWIPPNRIGKYNGGDPATTYTLAALSHPTASGDLAVEIIPFPLLPVAVTLEYRQADGWDFGIPTDAVVLHTYTPSASPYSFLMDKEIPDFPQGALVETGQTLTEPDYSITLNGIDFINNNASVTVGPGSGS